MNLIIPVKIPNTKLRVRWKHLNIFLILCLATLLRLPYLTGSLWMDEAAQALESVRPFVEQHVIPDDFQPPLFHYVVHFLSLFSRAEWWLRLASLIPGIATVYVTYLLAEKHGKRLAISASLLLATSPFHVFFSQELRPYALAAFFATLSWYILLSGQKKKYWWLAIVNALGLYTMYLYPFLLLSQIVFVFFERRAEMKKVCISLFVTGCLFSPWIPFFLEQLQIGRDLQSLLPGWSAVVATPQWKVIPLTMLKFFSGNVKIDGSGILAFFFSIPLLVLVAGLPKASWKKEWNPYFYWVGVTFLTAWLFSFLVPVIAPKRIMMILPAIVLVMARSRTSLIALILLVQVISLGVYWTTPRFQREDWRGMITRIQEDAGQQSARVVFAFPEPIAPWRWYQPAIPVTATGVLRVDQVEQIDHLFASNVREERIYVFDYLRDLSDPKRVVDLWLTTHGWERTSLLPGGDLGFVHVYTRGLEKMTESR